MAPKAEICPKGYHTVNVVATYKNTDQAIQFYKKAFKAQELSRMPGPNGSVLHAELRIGESVFMMGDEIPDEQCVSAETLKGSPVTFYLYLENADVVFDRAVRAGARIQRPMADMFWGDRCGMVVDPFGYRWSIATHMLDLTPEEIRKRGEEFRRAPALS